MGNRASKLDRQMHKYAHFIDAINSIDSIRACRSNAYVRKEVVDLLASMANAASVRALLTLIRESELHLPPAEPQIVDADLTAMTRFESMVLLTYEADSMHPVAADRIVNTRAVIVLNESMNIRTWRSIMHDCDMAYGDCVTLSHTIDASGRNVLHACVAREGHARLSARAGDRGHACCAMGHWVWLDYTPGLIACDYVCRVEGRLVFLSAPPVHYSLLTVTRSTPACEFKPCTRKEDDRARDLDERRRSLTLSLRELVELVSLSHRRRDSPVGMRTKLLTEAIMHRSHMNQS